MRSSAPCDVGVHFVTEADSSSAYKPGDLEALTAFCVENKELDDLEDILSEFNIFDAIGMSRQEIRHSTFLAFLLDPRGQHGFGDKFLTRFLQKAVHSEARTESTVNRLDIELMDLYDVIVLREHHNIDILIVSETNKLAVVIENKVGTSEHSDQLNRYMQTAQTLYPEYRKVPVFLSPEGVEPSLEDFNPISYEAVVSILDSHLSSGKTTIGSEVQVAITHYCKLIKRYIVTDSELDKLCNQIILKHKRALDILTAKMTSPGNYQRTIVFGILEDFGWTTTTNRAWPSQWNVWLPKGELDQPIIKFDFIERKGKITLYGYIFPGDQRIREAIYTECSKHPILFRKPKKLTPAYTNIMQVPLGKSLDREQDDEESWVNDLRAMLNEFCSGRLQLCEEVLRSAVADLGFDDADRP